VSVYSFIERREGWQAQCLAGVRAAEGLPCRLLSAAVRPSQREQRGR
jgi:hypothetical protein